MAPPRDLVRVVAAPDGRLSEGRSAPGRGAWLCAGSVPCIDDAARRRAFTRALRTDIGPDAIASLREAVASRGRMEGTGPPEA